MNLMAYRTLSMDFRRVSSNMLATDADSALVKLQRFKLFIDASPVITEIIQERISRKEFDYKECFIINEHSWNCYINPPVNEDFHLKAQYDFMSYLFDQDKDFRDLARRFVTKTGSWNDIVKEFLSRAFKPLVDFLVDSLGKKIMGLEGDRSVGHITQNINANYGNVNAAGRDATINSTTITNDIAQIKELIEKLRPTIDDAQLTVEEKEYLADDMETIAEQIESSNPKMPRLKKAYENVRKFVKGAASGVTSATLFLADWNNLVEKLEEFIKNT
ncbi:hypothetical protein UY286_04825 [Paenibacillus polymyxa]|uniref:hypothetical protein n=1 Tax=Paenibacillus polymyxa TaxID=1406 RepID=UPI002AB54B51|nr:hypothetical protein [Paenibacillus polymyxa]MDY7989879.1 hypothetical protein [Paenibacillus polymyxa]MDY8116762.1 hypothetical protein [Paenibacillus polymyxa]